MSEIGGYLELDTYTKSMLHEDAIAINCGRNALAYLLKSRDIKTLWIPKFICDAVTDVCKREGTEVRFYSISDSFRPLDDIILDKSAWLYLVNYYGQISNEEIKKYADHYGRIIVDQVQSYFQMPLAGIDTIYSCRKYFGVSDGAFLYTNKRIDIDLRDKSYERMKHLLGRYEGSASGFYEDYVLNEKQFEKEPIKLMSKLTENLLRGIDYDSVKEKRTENFRYLHKHLSKYNRLKLTVPSGPYMYPFFASNGADIRKVLQSKKIYIPILWPSVFEICKESELEYDMAYNILPLPIDQRYGKEEMMQIVREIEEVLN